MAGSGLVAGKPVFSLNENGQHLDGNVEGEPPMRSLALGLSLKGLQAKIASQGGTHSNEKNYRYHDLALPEGSGPEVAAESPGLTQYLVKRIMASIINGLKIDACKES